MTIQLHHNWHSLGRDVAHANAIRLPAATRRRASRSAQGGFGQLRSGRRLGDTQPFRAKRRRRLKSKRRYFGVGTELAPDRFKDFWRLFFTCHPPARSVDA
jgi:hypothetical protein